MGCPVTTLNTGNTPKALASTGTTQFSVANIPDTDENKSDKHNPLQNLVQESESGNDELAMKTNVWKN